MVPLGVQPPEGPPRRHPAAPKGTRESRRQWASQLGREAPYHPRVALAPVTDAVVESVLPVLPELVRIRGEPVAAPVRRPRHLAGMRRVGLGEARLERFAGLERLALPFTDDAVPSDAELRIAQAQLVGWLEGLFHGIQTALFAQQMAARVQLEQMRRGLPPGQGMHPGDQTDGPGIRGPGQYL